MRSRDRANVIAREGHLRRDPRDVRFPEVRTFRMRPAIGAAYTVTDRLAASPSEEHVLVLCVLTGELWEVWVGGNAEPPELPFYTVHFESTLGGRYVRTVAPRWAGVVARHKARLSADALDALASLTIEGRNTLSRTAALGGDEAMIAALPIAARRAA